MGARKIRGRWPSPTPWFRPGSGNRRTKADKQVDTW